MQRTWLWVAVAIAGAWWLFMLPLIGFVLIFPEPAASLGLAVAGLAWMAIVLLPAVTPRLAGAWFIAAHLALLAAVYLIFDQAIGVFLVPQAMALVAAVAAAIDLPVGPPAGTS